MKDRAFLDTNIFIYLYSNDEAEKRAKGISVLKQYNRITSTQALNEFCNVFIKKYKLPIEKIREFIGSISISCHIELITEEIVFTALTLKERYGYSYYDCLMLASALQYDCDVILSEDMSDGQIIEGKLKIFNPFKDVT